MDSLVLAVLGLMLLAAQTRRRASRIGARA
jgi:hypothetical protein